jgi:hypothetical protein
MAPVVVKQADVNGGQSAAEDRLFFRTITVFDVSQTEPRSRPASQPAAARTRR